MMVLLHVTERRCRVIRVAVTQVRPAFAREVTLDQKHFLESVRYE